MKGLCSNSHRLCVWWLYKSVRYVGVCRLQSAAEAQTGPAGYQTDTCHVRAGLRGCDASTGSRRTDPCLPGPISSHAEETE